MTLESGVTTPPLNVKNPFADVSRARILMDALKALSSSWRHDDMGHVDEKYLSIELAERGLAGQSCGTIEMGIKAGALVRLPHAATGGPGFQIHWAALEQLVQSAG